MGREAAGIHETTYVSDDQVEMVLCLTFLIQVQLDLQV